MGQPNDTAERPIFFYLVMRNGKPVIEKMSDWEMNKLWEKGVRTLDMPKRTRQDAEQVLAEYLKKHPEWR